MELESLAVGFVVAFSISDVYCYFVAKRRLGVPTSLGRILTPGSGFYMIAISGHSAGVKADGSTD